jgi:hypothetical protein
MGLFSSSKSSTTTQTFDERFVLSPSETGTALGQSGDSSVLSAPGSFASRDIGQIQAANMTFQNFDPDILKRAYAALDATNTTIGKFSSDLLDASKTINKDAVQFSESVIKAGETSAANADGQQYDLSQLAALATIAGLAWAVWG